MNIDPIQLAFLQISFNIIYYIIDISFFQLECQINYKLTFNMFVQPGFLFSFISCPISLGIHLNMCVCVVGDLYIYIYIHIYYIFYKYICIEIYICCFYILQLTILGCSPLLTMTIFFLNSLLFQNLSELYNQVIHQWNHIKFKSISQSSEILYTESFQPNLGMAVHSYMINNQGSKVYALYHRSHYSFSLIKTYFFYLLKMKYSPQ